MPVAARFGGYVFYAAVVPCLVAGAAVRTRTGSCPLSHCQSDNVDADASFLEVSSKKSGVTARARKGCGGTFLPAHFTCASCDMQTCKGCNNLVCDLSKCTGQFYKNECWCQKPNGKTDKFFCSPDCTGGLCNTQGLQCKSRDKACKPWWWCQLPPPKEPESFLQKVSLHQGGCAMQESAESLNARLEHTRAQIQQGSGGGRQIESFDFSTGSWECESALLPAPDEDSTTLQETPAGFIVFDADTCKGGFFQSKCYCYDKFKYFRGEDAKVTELNCDEGCSQGPCGGKSCGDAPPPPLPTPAPPPPVDPMVQQLAEEAMLNNMGTTAERST